MSEGQPARAGIERDRMVATIYRYTGVDGKRAVIESDRVVVIEVDSGAVARPLERLA